MPSASTEEQIQMVRTYEVRDDELEALLTRLRESDETVALSVDGEMLGIVVSPEEYERLREARIERNWQMIQRVQERNADKDPDEIMRDVDQAVADVRQQYREQQRSA
jgi:hypothetical protein